MKRLLLSVFILGLFLAGCGSKPVETTTIKVAAMKDVAHIPFVYAQETGMFEDAGLDVQITFFNSAKDRSAAWDTGEYNMETVDLAESIKLASQGEEITVTGCPLGNFKLVASPNVSASYDGDLSSLNGMSVGISENTVIEYYVDYIAEQNGITFVKTPIPSVPDRYSALNSDQIDLAILPDPFPSMAVSEGSKLIWESAQDGIPQLNSLNWSVDFDNEEAINTFLDVSNEAIKEMNENGPESYKQYTIDSGIIEEEFYDDITKGLKYKEIAKPAQEDWDAVTEWALSVGMIENSPSYEEFVK